MIHWRSGLELSKEVVFQRQLPETRNKSMSCLNELLGVTQQMRKFPPLMEPGGL